MRRIFPALAGGGFFFGGGAASETGLGKLEDNMIAWKYQGCFQDINPTIVYII
jgi:hypothetical protein